MPVTENIATWIGETVLTEGGDSIGVVDSIFLDEDTSDPEWVAVKFEADGNDRLIPIIAITPNGDQLSVTFSADVIASAPIVVHADDIQPDEEHQLYAHYGQGGVNGILQETGSANPVESAPNRRFRKLGT